RHTKEIAGSGRGNLPEGTVQAQGGVLQDVVRFLPPMDSRIGPKHLTRQAAQTLAGTLKQLAASRFVAVSQTIEIRLDEQGLRRGFRHAPAPCQGDPVLRAEIKKPHALIITFEEGKRQRS